MSSTHSSDMPAADQNDTVAPCWLAILLCAMAGGMGWGIRGRYGHESGAMMAGLLVGSVVAMLFLRNADGWGTMRAIAWCTVAIGFGGSETYGQTIGLTQNAHLIGNTSALIWGMLGLAIKGGLWIGFAGCFLGLALGGIDYRRRDMILSVVGLPLMYVISVRLINSPFDPATKQLPSVYFSETWAWKTSGDVKPGFECWGGLLMAMAGLMLYCGQFRRDRLAWRLGIAGLTGGALGFPGGQCLQANHAWNPEWYRTGIFASLDAYMNWWNMMEITFGTIMGGVARSGRVDESRSNQSPLIVSANPIERDRWSDPDSPCDAAVSFRLRRRAVGRCSLRSRFLHGGHSVGRLRDVSLVAVSDPDADRFTSRRRKDRA